MKITRRLRISAARIPTVLAVCWMAGGCGGSEKRIYSPPDIGNPSQPPAVSIIAPANGRTFRSSGDVRLLALATPNGTSLGPDEEASKHYANPKAWNFIQDPNGSYSVEFLAGANSVGLQRSAVVSASVRSQHGEAVPFVATMVGYPAVECVWHTPPPGTYILSARVVNAAGFSATSAPVTITIVP